MKKKNFKNKLNLNKKAVSNLNDKIVGGGWSQGCTDGCTPAQSLGNCTQANCTNDCTGGATNHQICTEPSDNFIA